MVAAISAAASGKNPRQKISEEQSQRPPLGPSEKDNGFPKKPKNREINSRYMSSISSSSIANPSVSHQSRRYPSPNVSKTSPFPERSVPKRSQSAERRRPTTPSPAQSRPATPLPDSKLGNGVAEISTKRWAGRTPEVLWPSTRSLSVSFQGEAFSLPINKRERQVSATVRTPTNVGHRTGESQRKGTPERKTTPLRGKSSGDHLENSKPVEDSHPRVDQHRWPGRTRGNGSANPLSRSLDCSEKPSRAAASLLLHSRSVRSDSVMRAFQQSINEGSVSRRVSIGGRLDPDPGSADSVASWNSSDSAKLLNMADGSCKITQPAQETERADSDNGSFPCDRSDTESVSSGSNSGVQEFRGVVGGRGIARGINVPARFWQETNNRLRRVQGLSSSLQELNSSSSSLLKTTGQPKLVPSKKGIPTLDSPLSSPRTVSSSRALSSPLRGSVRPASPSKLALSTSSPSRSMASPLRTRATPVPFLSVSSPSSRSSNSGSIFNFIADVRKGKKGANQIEDAHMLRLFYNRQLQWRFVNARADAALSAQRHTAEKTLYNAWVTTSELRDSVTVKRIELQLLRQDFKLTSILMGQMSYLEEWSLLDRDHSSSLSGAIEALKASTLRLPVIGGARADSQKVKDAVSSAVDVMQAMGSSICFLLSKVEGINSLVSELADAAAQERALLDECADLLSTIAAIQVEECSLRTHLIQLKRVAKPNTTVDQIL